MRCLFTEQPNLLLLQVCRQTIVIVGCCHSHLPPSTKKSCTFHVSFPFSVATRLYCLFSILDIVSALWLAQNVNSPMETWLHLHSSAHSVPVLFHQHWSSHLVWSVCLPVLTSPRVCLVTSQITHISLTALWFLVNNSAASSVCPEPSIPLGTGFRAPCPFT
jgi:hypothetical protein